MKLTHTDHAGTATAATTVALVLVVLGVVPVRASARQSAGAVQTQQSAIADSDRVKSRIAYGSTLFATWATVTNGNSSANAAEHRKELTGGHAGSANAAEAPAFRPDLR